MVTRLIPRLVLSLAILVLVLLAGATWWLWQANDFQVNGELNVSGLAGPVTVFRDERGMPYLFADDLDDLYLAQGFITAQHRLFQVLFYRELIHGRLAELIGEPGLASDRRLRLYDLPRTAARHRDMLGPDTERAMQRYAEGFNAYVREHAHEHPLELRLLGLEAEPLTVTDMLALAHFVALSQGGSYRASLVLQAIRDRLGDEAVARLLPPAVEGQPLPESVGRPAIADFALGDDGFADPIAVGSNAWAVAPQRSASGGAILANDPHLDGRVLPGVWHPIGLAVPGVEAVGVALPGLPGLLVGRNQYVAFGVTNSYGDNQDVYVERLDPDRPEHYLDGEESRAFRIREERIAVRDVHADGGYRHETLRIRETRRGPVISDHGERVGGRVLSLRRASADPASWEREPGFHALWQSRNVDELEDAARRMDLFLLNLVYAGRDGSIGVRATGRVPLRADGQGVFPRTVGAEDDWLGWLTSDQMPAERNPERGWIASANHDLRPPDAEVYYGFSFATGYRQGRLAQLLGGDDPGDTGEHWAYMLDIHNPQAEQVRPAMLAAMDRLLERDPSMPGLAEVREVLAAWDLRDHRDQAAPLIYQSVYRALAWQTFEPLLGQPLARAYLSMPYLWQGRFDQLLMDGELDRWHGMSGPPRELIERRALEQSLSELRTAFGPDPSRWRWGDAHRITFVSPLRTVGAGRDLFGGGSHPYSGSGETLLRAAYAQHAPYEARLHDSFRMLVDFGQADHMLANLAGGVVGRQFHAHFRDQLTDWLQGRAVPWHVGRDNVSPAARHRALLLPPPDRERTSDTF